MEVVTNMGSEKQRKMDREVRDIHSEIKRSKLVLKQRLLDVQNELKDWDFYGEKSDEGSSL